MIRVLSGNQEFRDKATTLLASGETMLIERHGHPVGYFVPIKHKQEAADAAMQRLAEAIEQVLDETGLSEDELAALFTLRREKRAAGR
jgi:antitoxin (DNA-binding transcriptional repressor) of toxin-antitoxin stability system